MQSSEEPRTIWGRRARLRGHTKGTLSVLIRHAMNRHSMLPLKPCQLLPIWCTEKEHWFGSQVSWFQSQLNNHGQITHYFFFFLDILFYFLFIYLNFIYLFIYGCVGSSFLCEGFLQLRQAGATPHRGAQASHHRGLSRGGAQAPDAQAQQLWPTGPIAPRHVGSSQTRARTRVPCIGRQTLNHCATREALTHYFESLLPLPIKWE